jgi:hypothetical protein
VAADVMVMRALVPEPSSPWWQRLRELRRCVIDAGIKQNAFCCGGFASVDVRGDPDIAGERKVSSHNLLPCGKVRRVNEMLIKPKKPRASSTKKRRNKDEQKGKVPSKSGGLLDYSLFTRRHLRRRRFS